MTLRIGERIDALETWRKRGTTVLGIVTALWVAWAQVLGPGIKPILQNFLGVSEVIARLEFIEVNMPAPKVVEWDEARSRQQGICDDAGCVLILTGARTEYGEECGKPVSAEPFIRTETGQTVQIGFAGFSPIELTRQPTTFTIPLQIPQFIPAGSHSVRIRVVYPSCPGIREPIPRWTPWFPLEVS